MNIFRDVLLCQKKKPGGFLVLELALRLRYNKFNTEAKMGKKCLSFLLLSSHLLFLMTCATTTVETQVDPGQEITPFKFPEVQLATTNGDLTTGKLLRFESQTLTILPYPYWNVDSIKVPLADIARIKLIEKKSRAGGSFLGGFSITFISAGLISGLAAKYDEDYETALAGSALLGGAVGLIALAIGGIADISTKKDFEFTTMPAAEKIASLRKIMGAY
jgi:hypothetical protein